MHVGAPKNIRLAVVAGWFVPGSGNVRQVQNWISSTFPEPSPPAPSPFSGEKGEGMVTFCCELSEAWAI